MIFIFHFILLMPSYRVLFPFCRFLRFLQYVLLRIKDSLKHLQPFFLRLHGQHNSAINNAIGDADSSVGAT